MSGFRGITLFESLIAVLLIGIASLTAIPPILEATENLRFGLFTSHVRSELHRVRILSISRNEDCRLRVTSRTSYVIECQSPDWTTLESRIVPLGIQVSANNAPEFHPLGNVGPMATIRIWLDDQQKRVVVSRSGRVRTE